MNISLDTLKLIVLKLLAFCQSNDWAGYDPYDALNSKIFNFSSALNCRIHRLVLTQLMKNSPVNFRPLLLVPKTKNPKAIALFLMALIKLLRLKLIDDEELIAKMVNTLVTLRSPETSYWCWGYSFPWQTRTILVPREAPNLVCTCFVANALLDAYENNHDSNNLNMAISAAEYILNELYWTESDSIACFDYPLPSLRSPIHNANLLGAALLCRVSKCCGDGKFLGPALKVAQYSAGKQNKDGSWYYSESPKQQWVDNFHTGYNLCALQSISRNAGTDDFEFHIRHGFKFYRKNFFRDDNAPKYFHDRIYPIDIHSVAQSIITLLKLREFDESSFDLAHSVLEWSIKHMWNERGYFYYRIYPFYKIKTFYMRWSGAWMFLALSTLLEECIENRVYYD